MNWIARMHFLGSQGQSLLEVVVAMGAAVLILTAVVGAVTNALNSTNFSTDQYMASQYAQQGMEVVRRIRDAGWDNFLALNNVSYCLDQNSSTLTPRVGSCGQNVGTYMREVTLTHNSPQCSNVSEVMVTVSWTDGKCRDTSNPYCHNTKLVSCFSDYNFLPTP